MAAKIKQKIIGHSVAKVTYFELNQPDRTFFHSNFDTFDVGVEIEMSNGFSWHIGWSHTEKHEIGIDAYQPPSFLDEFEKIDATEQWLKHGNSIVSDFEVIFVNRDWKIPAKCTLKFEETPPISIVLGEEINLDESLPEPLSFSLNRCIEIYVFYDSNLPEIEIVQIEFGPHYDEEIEIISTEDYKVQENESTDYTKRIHRPQLIGLFLLFIVVVIIVIHESLKN